MMMNPIELLEQMREYLDNMHFCGPSNDEALSIASSTSRQISEFVQRLREEKHEDEYLRNLTRFLSDVRG